MSSKLFNVGVVIGGFQPFHIGHEQLIDTALEVSDVVYVYLGSRKTDEENMFSFNTRKRLIEKIYHNKLDKLKFCCNEYKEKKDWSNYILELFNKTLPNNLPDIIIHGDEDFRRNWFNQNDRKFSELFIPRKSLVSEIDVSGTKIRKALIDQDYEYCKTVLNSLILDELDNLRNELIKNNI